MSLASWLRPPQAYAQIYRNRLLLQLPGRPAVQRQGEFSHPRALVGRFAVAEGLLREALREAMGNSLLLTRPRLIVHPKEVLEGGLTDIEERALRELGLGAGAMQVALWLGEDLSPEAVQRFNFKEAA